MDLLENKITSIIIVIVLIVLDQYTKYITRLNLKDESIEIISNFFYLTYIENRGAAFGLFQGQHHFFAFLSILIIAILIFYYKKQKEKKLEKLNYLSLILILIISGAVGNLIDRIYFGFVTDMIDVSGIWSFVFNLADVYVVCGFICLVIYTILYDKESKI